MHFNLVATQIININAINIKRDRPVKGAGKMHQCN